MSGPQWNSAIYATARPRYCKEVYDAILAFGGAAMGRTLAVDGGCGSGQVAADLSPIFNRVIGLDTNQDQLIHAFQKDNVEYRLAEAENTGLEASSVDLVTASAALHWMNVPAFSKEAARILHPGGVLAVWCYNMPPRLGNHVADEAFLRTRRAFFPYFDHRLQYIMDHGYTEYAHVLKSDFDVVEEQTVMMTWHNTIAGIADWARSWSAYVAMSQAHGREKAEELVVTLREELLNAFATSNDGHAVPVELDLDVVLAKCPKRNTK
jgi:ubiquinone/menaquinone biosynthesis C-methylase UbiE